jgi:serine/threonine protein kinase
MDHKQSKLANFESHWPIILEIGLYHPELSMCRSISCFVSHSILHTFLFADDRLRGMSRPSSPAPQNRDAEASKALYREGYILQDRIADGGFAQVYQVQSRQYQTKFACKMFDFTLDNDDSFKAEVAALAQLYHPNVIQIFTFFRSETLLYQILEFCPGGSVKDLINSGRPLTDQDLRRHCQSIVSALLFCHSKDIAHRDIKPANLLIDKYNRIKLADFGLACVIERPRPPEKVCGSVPYMAPEVLQKRSFDPKAADIWALGVTLFEMAARRLPWAGDTVEEMEEEIYAGRFEVPPSVPPRLALAIRGVLVVDPRKRWTQKELVHFDYFAGTRSLIRRPFGSRPIIIVQAGPYPTLPVSAARLSLPMTRRRRPTFQHPDDIFIEDE